MFAFFAFSLHLQEGVASQRITALLEMAFAGNCGLDAEIFTEHSAAEELFAEEPGFLLEVSEANKAEVLSLFARKDITCGVVGRTRSSNGITVSINGEEVVGEDAERQLDAHSLLLGDGGIYLF